MGYTRAMICELRNYTTQPGRRDDLVALFEREFLDSQETMGSRIVGTFRNVDDPDRFVWMRAFADMPARAAALDAFYTSAAWLERRAAANATIVDSDDVLLLRPVAGRLIEQAPVRAPVGASGRFASRIVVDTWFLEPRTEESFSRTLRRGSGARAARRSAQRRLRASRRCTSRTPTLAFRCARTKPSSSP